MKNTKRSITLKVIAGYILLTALAVFAVWFIYGQIQTISSDTEINNRNNQKLFLISEAATKLFIAEGISKEIIQNQNVSQLPLFKAEIDTVSIIIDSLKSLSQEIKMKIELDSVSTLLQFKTRNLEELLELRAHGTTESYYAKVINRLQKVDDYFEDDNYEEQLSDLDPVVRRALLGFIEYSRENNANQLTQKTADSLVNSLKLVLSDLEVQERRTMLTINQKENELLENDRIISDQLRKLRTEIEQDEIIKSVEQVAASQYLLQRTSVIIGGLGIVSILTILVFIALIMSDTKKSQKYRQQLEASKNYTERLLKSREQIMAAVTHDLRSPLNTVIGYSDLLSQSELSDKQKHYLNNLKGSSDYILRLVNDLLDLSKLEAGKMHIEKLRFNLENIINESIKNAIPADNPKKIILEIHMVERLKEDIISDPFRLQQILTNLISNAYKFTQEGKITIQAELKKINKNPNTLKMRVIDTGIGISSKHQQNVFDEFSQGDKSIEKQYGGYGLGLAITKKLLSVLKGDISVSSRLGEGSTFTFYFPIEFPDKNVLENAVPKENKTAPSMQDKRILILDDEPSQLALTGEILKNVGAVVETASQGAEALIKLNEQPVDLILTDIQMPGMDGFEFLKTLKEDGKTSTIPVIAVSGNTDLSPDEFIRKGFDGKLTKPYTVKDLLDLIHQKIKLPNVVPPIYSTQESKENGHYNLQDLLLFTQGDSASLDAILHTFINSSRQSLQEMEAAISQKDFKRVSGLAHKMLPMFRQLKIDSCIPHFEELEHLQEEDISLVRKKIHDLKESIETVFENLEKELTV